MMDKRSNDPICTIVLPSDDEINLKDIAQYEDRWFLGFMDVFDVKDPSQQVGELMYDASGWEVFKLSPRVRCTPDSFTPSPDISKLRARYGKNIPSDIDLLNISDSVLGLMRNTYTKCITLGDVNTTVSFPLLTIKAYSSWKGCAKAQAEYFIRNREFLGIDDSVDANKFFVDMVHPKPIELRGSPEGFTIKGEHINPLATIADLVDANKDW